MTKKIVEIQDIKKEFNQKTVLSNITFSIKKNECIALLGKNGAGKSTLLNIIIGKYFQNDGNLKIYCEKKNVGFLPQNTNFPDDIKVNELIKFVSSYTDTPLSEEEVALILNFSNEQMNKFASKLSGGQQRLLDFCLAVINKPQFLIVDEPTSSMDTSTRHHFWECIQQLKEKGTTVLFTTHYIEEVNYCADRVLLLDNGNLMADETPYRLRMLNHEKIIVLDINLYKQFEQPLQHIIICNQIKEIFSKSTVEFYFVAERTDYIIKALLSIGFPIKEVELTNTSLLDTIFEGTHIEETQND